MDEVTRRLEERLDRVAERALGELRAGLSMARNEVNARFDQVPTRDETNGRFAEMDARFDESRRHFEVLLEATHAEIRLVAEGVTSLGERMERGFADLRELIADNHRFWEVAFLDHERRLRTLEGTS